MTAPIRGVLFDIDDTLVDLRSAALNGFLAISGPDLAHLHPERRTEIAADFADDGAQAYERYMSGELTFLGQRTFAACIPNGKNTFTYRRKVYPLGRGVRGKGPRVLETF